MSTWYDLKLKTLQKLFAAQGNTIPTDTSTADYIASMPGACNEALQMLATAGKFIIKYIDIAHNPVRNLLSDGDRIKSMERGDLTFEADGVRSMFFEYTGVGTYEIYVGDELKENGTLSNKNGYVAIRKLVENPDDKKVRLVIHSDYPLAMKNIALYSANFETEEDIQSFSEQIRYSLKELAPDFYMLDAQPIVYEGGADTSRYTSSTNFFQEGNTVLALPRDIPGNFRIFYKSYPQMITSDTTDDTELSIDPEVEALIPLYMASQLYKDDDNGIATSYRNEFEVAFERLRDSAVAPTAEKFECESGWC